MAHEYVVVDLESWKRKVHCQVFMNAMLPQYCVSLELDVTRFRSHVREKGLSFSLAFIYAVTRCANRIEEFRYRFLDGKVVLYESINTAFAHLDKGAELFKFVSAPMRETMEEYVRLAAETAVSQKEYFAGPLENDVFIFSALPWVTFTHVSHTDSGDRERAQPMFDWGRYRERDGTLLMPFSVQVHHSFVDGIHIGKLVTELQSYLDALGE